MTWARVQQEVRQMRFEELYERRQQRTLSFATVWRKWQIGRFPVIGKGI